MGPEDSFENIFGHCAHQAIKVETAVRSLLNDFRSPIEAARIASIVALMSYPPMEEQISVLPACSDIMRRYIACPPAGSIRGAQLAYEGLSEEMQEAIVAVVFQALVRWQALARVLEADIGLANAVIDDPQYLQGAGAFQCLIGFDCLMAESSPDQSKAKADDFVAIAMTAVVAQSEDADESAGTGSYQAHSQARFPPVAGRCSHHTKLISEILHVHRT